MSKTTKGEYPRTFSADVLLRTLGPKEMKAMWEKYQANRLRKHLAEPTKLHYSLAEARKLGGTAKAIATKYKVKEHQVHEALKRVAVWEYLKS